MIPNTGIKWKNYRNKKFGIVLFKILNLYMKACYILAKFPKLTALKLTNYVPGRHAGCNVKNIIKVLHGSGIIYIVSHREHFKRCQCIVRLKFCVQRPS